MGATGQNPRSFEVQDDSIKLLCPCRTGRELVRFLSIIMLLAAFSSAAYAVVCRNAYVSSDWVAATARIKTWLPPETSDPSKIGLFLSTDRDGNLYVQSNFVSKSSDGKVAEHPTKILEPLSKFTSINDVLLNIINWGSLAPGASEQASVAARNMDLFLDPKLLRNDGRPPFDLSTAKSIRLATVNERLMTGIVEPLRLGRPPPPFIERIDGCCLHGRPAGRGVAIRESLERIKFEAENLNLLQLVADSATDAAIMGSTRLRAAAERGGAGSSATWQAKIETAFANSKDRTLVILSHIENGKVVVEDLGGSSKFEIPIDEMHAQAQKQGVNLILLGCDTAREAKEDSIPVSVIGRYNTVRATELLDKALSGTSTASEFLTKLSDESLVLIVQEGSWSPTGFGASAYVKPTNPLSRLRRILRVWFLGTPNGK